ncbi:MAG: CrcB family protein [Pseudomonadota bacterium]
MPGWIWVAIGGAAGAVARYGVNQALAKTGGMLISTLVVNVFGSLLLGVLTVLFLQSGMQDGSSSAKLLAITGFCGAFTTMSALALETQSLIAAGDQMSGVGYGLLNLSLSVAALFAGVALTRAIVS